MKYLRKINWIIKDKNYTLKIIDFSMLFDLITEIINKFLLDNNLNPKNYFLLYYDKDSDLIYIKSKNCFITSLKYFDTNEYESFDLFYEKINEENISTLSTNEIKFWKEGFIPLNNKIYNKMKIREYIIFKMFEHKIKQMKNRLKKYKNEYKYEKKMIFKNNNEEKLQKLDIKIKKKKKNLICDECGTELNNKDYYACTECKEYECCKACFYNICLNTKHQLAEKDDYFGNIKFKIFLDSCDKIKKENDNDKILLNMSIINIGNKELPSDFCIINKLKKDEFKINIGNIKQKEKKNFSFDFDIDNEKENLDLDLYGYSNGSMIGEEYLLSLINNFNNEKIDIKLKKKKKSLFNIFTNLSKNIFDICKNSKGWFK